MARPKLTEQQRDEIRRIMLSPLADSRGRSVTVLTLSADDPDRFPVREAISPPDAEAADLLRRAGQAMSDAGYVVTLTRLPGEPNPDDWRQRPSPVGRVLGETSPVRAERRFRVGLTIFLTFLALGVGLGTYGALALHSGFLAFVGYAAFILPAFVGLLIVGTEYDSETIVATLSSALGAIPLGGPNLGAGAMVLTFVGGSTHSRERSSRGRSWRRLTRVQEGPRTRADLRQVVDGFTSPPDRPLPSFAEPEHGTTGG